MRLFNPSDINVHLFFEKLNPSNLANILKEKHVVVQTLSYQCTRKRDNQGRPYGSTQETLMDFVVIASSANQLKKLYQLVKENTSTSLSFIFNPEYKLTGDEKLSEYVLDTYNRALSVTGYVVEIDEVYGYGDTWLEAENAKIAAYNSFVKELERFKGDVETMISDVRKESGKDSFPLQAVEPLNPLMVVRARLLVDSIQYIARDKKSIQLYINF